MPIRFRCAYCNQLLGISRRKSGKVVRCPTCAGQVVVPSVDEVPDENDAPEAPAPAAGGGQLFEGSEIDRLLEGAGGDQPSALASVGRETMKPASAPAVQVPAAAPAPAPAAVVPAPMPMAASGPAPGARPPGLWLTPAQATLVSVLAVIALAVTFGAGLLVGLFIARR